MANGALRERQVGLTRDLIMEALAEVIAEGRLAEFSMQDVADRAGTSLRTLYRSPSLPFSCSMTDLFGDDLGAGEDLRGGDRAGLNLVLVGHFDQLDGWRRGQRRRGALGGVEGQT